ncbi:DUF3782 domain-containing protein [Vulcanisaeta moutnovskia]|nr:DUF3782 domain-containing protein [Vulcanisaeta moutnovskia]
MTLNRRLDALGARWSVISEETFRKDMMEFCRKNI